MKFGNNNFKLYYLKKFRLKTWRQIQRRSYLFLKFCELKTQPAESVSQKSREQKKMMFFFSETQKMKRLKKSIILRHLPFQEPFMINPFS